MTVPPRGSRNRYRMTNTQLDRIVSRTLRSGVIVSAVLMIIGFMMYALNPRSHTGIIASNPFVIWKFLLSGPIAGIAVSPILYLSAGIVVLLCTPVARICVAMAGFAAEKDWRFFLVSVIVLCIIAVSIVIAVVNH